MADDQVTVAVVLAVVAVVVGFFEVRFLRKRMKHRRIRAAKGDDNLQDQAHNAVVTTKAILSAMERQGIRSEEAAGWLREAETAVARQNFRVAMELTGRAKDRLLTLKAEQTSKGDLAKLDRLATPSSGGGDEITTKELIQKEFPPNLMQSKFSIEVAGTAIETSGAAGRDVGQAAQLLEAAKSRFDAKDYSAALALARQSKRVADGASIGTPLPVPPTPVVAVHAAPDRVCPTCDSALQSDDVFCRKCGTRLVPSECRSCGANLLADDVFCRKCGTPVAR